MSMNLSNVIRIWRRATGKKLREASQEIGIPIPTLSRIERGQQQVGGGRDGQSHQGQKPATNGNGIDGRTLARILRWLLDDEAKGK